MNESGSPLRPRRRLSFLGYFDLPLIAVVLCLAGIGLTGVYSATLHGAQSNLFLKQIIWICAGTVLFLFLNLSDYRFPIDHAFVIYAAAVFRPGRCASVRHRSSWESELDPNFRSRIPALGVSQGSCGPGSGPLPGRPARRLPEQDTDPDLDRSHPLSSPAGGDAGRPGYRPDLLSNSHGDHVRGRPQTETGPPGLNSEPPVGSFCMVCAQGLPAAADPGYTSTPRSIHRESAIRRASPSLQ